MGFFCPIIEIYFTEANFFHSFPLFKVQKQESHTSQRQSIALHSFNNLRFYFSYKTQVTHLTAASATIGSFLLATVFSLSFYFLGKKLMKRRQPLLPTISMSTLQEQERRADNGSDGSATPTPSGSTTPPTNPSTQAEGR